MMMQINDVLQKNAKDMVTAAFFVRGREILIGLRNYASGPVWTTPGWKCLPDETIESGLRRETREEVGVEEMEILEYLGDVRAASIDRNLSVFICTTQQAPKLLEPDKFSYWKWCDIEAIPEPFINIPALELVKWYLLK